MWNKIETVTFADDKVVQATELSKGSTNLGFLNQLKNNN